MFRPRPPHPMRGRGRPDIPPVLQRANRLFESGQYEQAAEAFEQIAKGALARQGPRAPMFLMQAGRARILNGQAKLGLEHLKGGLSIFADRRQFPHIYRAGGRAVIQLKNHGFANEASQLEAFVKGLLPAGFTPPPSFDAPAAKKKAVLPTHCPSCGAGVRPDEVDWLDDLTAECAYCGSPVRGE